MQSFNTWNLTNNQLHQLFKDKNQFISIKVRGNTWEPISRWLRLDSRIFKETTNRPRITLCDIESLAEIYNYRSIRWKAKKLTPNIPIIYAQLGSLYYITDNKENSLLNYKKAKEFNYKISGISEMITLIEKDITKTD